MYTICINWYSFEKKELLFNIVKLRSHTSYKTNMKFSILMIEKLVFFFDSYKILIGIKIKIKLTIYNFITFRFVHATETHS